MNVSERLAASAVVPVVVLDDAKDAVSAAKALLAGGVASSALLRGEIIERVSKRNAEIRLHFARPELSGDNAVGVALIGAEKFGGGAVGQAD